MKFIKSLYFSPRFFAVIAALVTLFVFGHFFTFVYAIAKGLLLVFFMLLIADFFLLFNKANTVNAVRETPEKLSNGDENELKITFENYYPFRVVATIIDEIPFQFQIRNFWHQVKVAPGGLHLINYKLRPVKRGEYSFGALNVFISSPIGFIRRRFSFCQDKMVAVYPSYIQMNKYELIATTSRLKDSGIKHIRRLGHSLEFEKIREYVNGDDHRTINWKATGRKAELMVNQYQDEKSQPVYCLIDKGRVMQMPFNGMSLLDYAINTSLVIANIALNKQDKAGLVTFSHQTGNIVKADRKRSQLKFIMEVLYKQKTQYLETDFRKLYSTMQRVATQRSLLLLFTNFGSLNALRRQLPYLKALAKNHLLVVVFFENTELSQTLDKPVENLEQVYIKTIAEQFVYEKKQMVKELEAYGIHSILSSPENLTVKALNKYLELKSRRMI